MKSSVSMIILFNLIVFLMHPAIASLNSIKEDILITQYHLKLEDTPDNFKRWIRQRCCSQKREEHIKTLYNLFAPKSYSGANEKQKYLISATEAIKLYPKLYEKIHQEPTKFNAFINQIYPKENGPFILEILFAKASVTFLMGEQAFENHRRMNQLVIQNIPQD